MNLRVVNLIFHDRIAMIANVLPKLRVTPDGLPCSEWAGTFNYVCNNGENFRRGLNDMFMSLAQ